MTQMLTAERARELLDYDPATGAFVQRIAYQGRLGARWKPGRLAGSVCKQSGYLSLRLDGKLYQAHRVAWLMAHGSWPERHIDHINGQRLDNRIANLRDVPNVVNRENMHRARADSATGLAGVQFSKRHGRYYAHIKVRGRNVFLGFFDRADEAHKAYLDAKAQLHVGWSPTVDVPSLTDNHQVNASGARRARSDSTTGLTGARPVGKRFRASIVLDGKQRHLGTFDSAEAAHAAYLRAALARAKPIGGGLRD